MRPGTFSAIVAVDPTNFPKEIYMNAPIDDHPMAQLTLKRRDTWKSRYFSVFCLFCSAVYFSIINSTIFVCLLMPMRKRGVQGQLVAEEVLQGVAPRGIRPLHCKSSMPLVFCAANNENKSPCMN